MVVRLKLTLNYLKRELMSCKIFLRLVASALCTFFFIFALFHSQISLAQQNTYFLTSALETDDCFISFLECSDEKFVLKQIKEASPDEQFLLVLDALGCHIAETSAIPMNRVTIIPSGVSFSGKKILELPATLHTLARGVTTEEESPYQDLDVHQRFRKENSPMWHRWGPLSPEKTGLTISIIQAMSKHSDLPKIVALDTFVGNADRSSPNLYYDKTTDRFCGIDMAASFSAPLAFFAYRQLEAAKDKYFTHGELTALEKYVRTLEFLIKNWPPERQERMLLEYSEIAGFKKGNPLFDQNVADRIEFHKKNMHDNYRNCVELIKQMNIF